jgi:antitoxin HicB
MPESRSFAVVLQPDPEGGYTVVAPALPGVLTEGDMLDEALANARDAIQLCLQDLAEQGLEIPESDIGARLERVEVPIAS